MISGSHHTKEAKEKLSLSKKGKHYSIATEIKKDQHLSSKTEFKKGMIPWNKGIKMWNEKKHPFLGKKRINTWNKGKGEEYTHSYQERRRFQDTMQKQVFERDDYTCQLCGIRGIDLQVDHIQSWAEYIELRFEISNCRTVCAKCHYKITFGRPMPENISGWGHNFLKARVRK